MPGNFAACQLGTVQANPDLNSSSELIPVGRMGTVEEVADIVVLLACNGYITGQTFNVNGGWYMS